MDAGWREGAAQARARIERGDHDRVAFRAALHDVPARHRDAWLDDVLGLNGLPDDDPGHLPAGCVPYLPSPVDVLLRVVDRVPVRADDVFVDVGAGTGRAGALVHLLTGATVVGIEIQPALAQAGRSLAARLRAPAITCSEGDASESPALAAGTVFFLYCPFGGARLTKLVEALEPIARTRRIHVCCLDMPMPACPWLAAEPPFAPDLAFYRSTIAIGDQPARSDSAT